MAGTATSVSGVTLKGSGLDIGGAADSGHIVYQTLSGNCEVIARVASVQNTDANAKAGVIIRETVSPGAPFAFMCITPGAGASFIRRATAGAAATTTSGGATVVAPYWVRLVRSGSTFYSYKSSDGATWQFVASAAITMATNVQVGFAVTSKTNPTLCTAVLDNFSTSIDSDADGLPDRWEQQYFGNLTQTGTGDYDGDGKTNAQELADGTSPIDYYNGVVPTVTVVSGNNQTGAPNTFLSAPLIVKVMNGATAMNNAPVSFSVTQGGGQLSATSGGALSPTLLVRTAATGQVSAYFKTPAADDATDLITATAGTAPALTFTAISDSLPRTGLKMWLRGDRGVIKNASNQVSAWNDQSGNGKNGTQGVAANQPLAVDNLFNGRTGLRMSNSFLNLPNFLTTLTQSTVFIVHRVSLGAFDNNGFWQMGGGAFSSSTYPGSDDFGSSTSHSQSRTLQSVNDAHIYSVVSRPGEWTSRLNDKIWTSSSTNTVAFPTAPKIGKNSNYYFMGDIAEVILYDRTLSTAELDTVTSYLNSKYAIATSTPTVPLSVTATALSATSASVNWRNQDENVATTYAVERKTGAGGTYAQIGIVRDATGFADTGLIANTAYTYRVKTTQLGQSSGYSNEAPVTTLAADALPMSGMVEWLRADLGITQNGRDAVIAWSDQSGNNNNAVQPGKYSQPKLVPNTLNGKPVFRFGPGYDINSLPDQYLNLPNFLSSLTAAEVFVVLKAVNATPGNQDAGGLWNLSANGAVSSYPVSSYWTPGCNVQDNFGSANAGYLGKPSQPIDRFGLYNVVSKPGEWTNRLNGVQLFTTATNTVAFSASPDTGQPFEIGQGFDGYFAEVIIYNRALSVAERQTVQTYLNQKYALVPSSLTMPAGLVVNPISTTQTSLVWNGDGNSSTSYKVERRPASGSYSQIATVPAGSSYLDSGLIPATQYFYRISATNMVATSSPSVEVAVTTLSAGTTLPLIGLACWLKADSGVVTDSSGGINGWLDQSGNGVSAYQDYATRPNLIPADVFGRPVAAFDGINGVLNLPQFLGASTEGEVFVVVQAAEDMPVNNRGLWTMGAGGSSEYPAYWGAITENFGSSVSNNTPTPVKRLSYYNVYNVLSSATEWTSRLNGTVNFTRPDNTFAFTGSPALGKSNTGAFFAGNIAEALIFDHAMSPGERTTIESYLENKYGISDSDGDGLPDWWEMKYFGNLLQDGNGDPDQDGLSNADEFLLGLNPLLADTDGDGMPDGFEVANGLNPLVNDANGDLDGDGVPNWQDAKPMDPGIGLLNIIIANPQNNSIIP